MVRIRWQCYQFFGTGGTASEALGNFQYPGWPLDNLTRNTHTHPHYEVFDYHFFSRCVDPALLAVDHGDHD